MRRKFESLRNSLQQFVEQRDYLTMVLHLAHETDITYVLKYLEALEQQSRQDLYLVFGHSAVTPTEYIDSAMAEAEMSIELGNAALAEGLGQRGCEPWPGLPSACFDPARSPLQRIQALVAFLRERYPSPNNRIVLAFLPLQVGNGDAYRAAVQELFPVHGYEPWMAGVRILVSDRQADPKLVPWLREDEVFGTLIYPLDFSTAALREALVEEATDRSLPMDQRMAALVQVAANDHAWGRLDDALRKYGAAYDYYLAEKDVAMQGLCLIGSAWVLERAERIPEARERFRQALEHAIANEQLPLMLNAFLSLAQLHQREEDWPEAQQYWRGAVLTAKGSSNAIAMADALEQEGICLIAMNQTAEALPIWEVAAKVAKDARYWDRRVSVLEHLIEMEGRLGMREQRALHEQELEEARLELRYAQHEIEQVQKGAS